MSSYGFNSLSYPIPNWHVEDFDPFWPGLYWKHAHDQHYGLGHVLSALLAKINRSVTRPLLNIFLNLLYINETFCGNWTPLQSQRLDQTIANDDSVDQNLATGTQDFATLADLFATESAENKVLATDRGLGSSTISSLFLLGVLGLVKSALKIALSLE
ncbi:MAG: hypothetical protein MMC33_001805 [Icmadophila ericetorum]|nr:hypothetical protein [Icmadophila ericetorum]